jgi:hypothetical protein
MINSASSRVAIPAAVLSVYPPAVSPVHEAPTDWPCFNTDFQETQSSAIGERRQGYLQSSGAAVACADKRVSNSPGRSRRISKSIGRTAKSSVA